MRRRLDTSGTELRESGIKDLSERVLKDIAPLSSPASLSSRRTSSRAGKGRVVSLSSSNDLYDGESLTKGSDRANIRVKSQSFKYAHSPGAGGFGLTPFFLNSHFPNNKDRVQLPLLKSATTASLLPSSADLVELMLSMSSHRTGQEGFIRSWMSGVDRTTQAGKVRLLTCLGFVLMEGDCYVSGGTACPLTWEDIGYLLSLREEFRASAEIGYLVSILLEDAIQKDLSLKFRLENVLDFNDQITVRGWTDGGRDSAGTHSEELRASFHQRCRDNGIELDFPKQPRDLSPCRNNDELDHHPSQEFPNDPFAHCHVERVFGRGAQDEDREESTTRLVDVSTVPSTPKPRGYGNDQVLRETIVVDVQTDHSLRRHINKAFELRKQFANDDRIFAEELQKFVLRRLHFQTPETHDVIFKMAKASQGFVHIGDVRSGSSSRHFAILFKTLCDATGLHCRLVRADNDDDNDNDVYYNVVMISEPPYDGESENRQVESNSSALERSDSAAGEVDDAPEELVPIFWEGAQSRARKLSHPLDILLQKCNSAAKPVDLDEFFRFDNLLGKGSFGEVWKVDLKVKPAALKNFTKSLLTTGGRSFALKLIPAEEADKEEASFMRIYRHARVINVLAVFRGYQVLENRKREMEKKPAMCILMELADKCLETVLSENSGSPLDLRFVFRILIDSARAMTYLHSPLGSRPHVLHRDLKPGNILITRDSRAIVTDFGVARMNPSLETNLTVGAGTEGYMAPEQKTLLYDRPADVYSFGVIIARLLGAQQWRDATLLTASHFHEKNADPVLVQLCLKCVQCSPLLRPSFEQIHKLLLCEFIKREFARTILETPKSAPKKRTNTRKR